MPGEIDKEEEQNGRLLIGRLQSCSLSQTKNVTAESVKHKMLDKFQVHVAHIRPTDLEQKTADGHHEKPTHIKSPKSATWLACLAKLRKLNLTFGCWAGECRPNGPVNGRPTTSPAVTEIPIKPLNSAHKSESLLDEMKWHVVFASSIMGSN